MSKLYETINKDNWCKNALHLGQRSCLVGHCMLLKLNEHMVGLPEAIRALYPERVNGTYMDVVDFNNHPDTTVEDVIRVCKVAGV